MAEPDFLDRLQAGRDALRKAQQSLARYTLTAEQRRALMDGMARMAVPGDQVQSLVDLMDSFGPPVAQIDALRTELAEQRVLFDQLGERLAHMESLAERLAIAGEQLVAYQEPFVRMASMFTGQDYERKSRRAADDSGDTDASSDDPTRSTAPGEDPA